MFFLLVVLLKKQTKKPPKQTNTKYQRKCTPFVPHIVQYTRVALKVMPPILLCWPVTSEAGVGGMAVGIETSHKYSIKCYCCITDGHRGSV